MSDSTADEILKRQSRLASDRANWESHWRECAERVLPRQADIQTTQTKGAKRTQQIYDSTAQLALPKFAAALESQLTPRNERWHGLRASDEALNEIPEVREYFEKVTDILFRYRYAPSSNFASQKHEDYMALGCFGTSALFIDAEVGLRYRAVHINDLYLAENHVGRIDTVNRRLTLNARQAAQRWGADALPKRMQAMLEKGKDQDKEFTFFHMVMPNEERIASRADYVGMEYASYYVNEEERATIKQGGYRSFPYAVSRYVTAPREIYGRSPAMMALPDIKMLNAMEKTQIRAAHKMVDPPLLIHDDADLKGALSLQPGALNYGALGPNGERLVDTFNNNANLNISLEMQNQKRDVINDAFLVTMFQILVDAPSMTATEVMERAKEKGALLAPTAGRQQSESLGVQIPRELEILFNNDLLPELPEALIEAEGDYEIQYDGPMARAQKAEQVVGFLRTMEAIAPLANIDPGILRRFNGDQILKDIAEINAQPSDWLLSDDDLARIQEAENQAQQASNMLAAAPVAAEAAKTMAQAQQLAGQ